MTDYNKYNTNLILKTAMQDPNMAEQVNQALGTISKPTSSVFPTGEFMGMSVSPRVQEVINTLTQLPVGAGGATIGATGSGKNLLNKLLSKARQNRAIDKSIARHKNKPDLNFKNRKINRELDKETKEAYEYYTFGEAFDDQPMPKGIYNWKTYNKRNKEIDRFFKNRDQYQKSFEKVRENYMEGMHMQGLDEEDFMRKLRDFEVVYDPYSPEFDPKALLNLVRGSKGKKSIYDVDVQEGWDQYVDDSYLKEGIDAGAVDYDKHLYHLAHDLPNQKSPLQKVIDADILHDAYTGGRFTPGMSSKTGSVPGGKTPKATSNIPANPVTPINKLNFQYKNLANEYGVSFDKLKTMADKEIKRGHSPEDAYYWALEELFNLK